MQYVPNTTTFLIKLIYDYVKDNKYNMFIIFI
jgi:hypothetical protein